MKKADPPLTVHIPTRDDDHPSWMRVGIIAVVGFAIGVAWPKLAGVKLGPNAPSMGANGPWSSFRWGGVRRIV